MDNQHLSQPKLSRKEKRHIKKITPVQTTISRLSHDGRGIDDSEGKIKFVFNALPGETCESYFITQKSSFAEYQAKNILQNPSSNRSEPICEFYQSCGGCQLQHMQRSTQLELKQNSLLEMIKHQAATAAKNIMPPLQGKGSNYRHKARLGVKYLASKDELVVGFRERFASRFINKISSCEVLADPVGKQIPILQQMIKQLSIRDKIPQIEVAIAENATALVLRHLAPFADEDLGILTSHAKKYQWQIILQPNPPQQLKYLYPRQMEKLKYTLADYNLSYLFTAQQFTQVNPEMNQQMVAQAIDLLDLQTTDNCLDLYCGIGNFTLAMAKAANKVTGIEGAADAISQAKENAALNNISNTEFHTQDLTKPLENISWAKQKYDKLLLDPARCGAIEIIPYIKTWQPQRIVYVSCNPATLARDCKEIISLGYSLEKLGIIDMFPHTAHVESMALFVKS